MFTNQRGSVGLASIVAVAAVIALHFASVAMCWKAYREGGTNGSSSVCEVACRGNQKSPSHG